VVVVEGPLRPPHTHTHTHTRLSPILDLKEVQCLSIMLSWRPPFTQEKKQITTRTKKLNPDMELEMNVSGEPNTTAMFPLLSGFLPHPDAAHMNLAMKGLYLFFHHYYQRSEIITSSSYCRYPPWTANTNSASGSWTTLNFPRSRWEDESSPYIDILRHSVWKDFNSNPSSWLATVEMRLFKSSSETSILPLWNEFLS